MGLSWIIRSICSLRGDLQMFAASIRNLVEDPRPQSSDTTRLYGEQHRSRGPAFTPHHHPKHTVRGMTSPESNSPRSNGRANLHRKVLKSSPLQLLSLQIFGRLQEH